MDSPNFNLSELFAYFSKRWNLDDREGFREALRYQERFEAELPEAYLDGMIKLGTHPEGPEIWLWNGNLLSTKVNLHAVCEHCYGRRLLCWHGEWRSFWYCLDCKEEVCPVDAETRSPNACFD